MAAVSVVLPWSMWPIVPTLTCGLSRSNFSFAICDSLLGLKLSVRHEGGEPLKHTGDCLELGARPDRLAGALTDDGLCEVVWHFLVPVELHAVVGASLG